MATEDDARAQAITTRSLRDAVDAHERYVTAALAYPKRIESRIESPACDLCGGCLCGGNCGHGCTC